MASEYGMLPTEVLNKATTMDLQIHYTANLIRYREEKRARGEDITDTYSKQEIEEMYAQFRGSNQ